MKTKYINDINPANGKLIKRVRCSTKAEIYNAVKKAKNALSSWCKLSLKERSKRLEAAAKDFINEKERIGKIITDEMGKLYKSTRAKNFVSFFYLSSQQIILGKQIAAGSNKKKVKKIFK